MKLLRVIVALFTLSLSTLALAEFSTGAGPTKPTATGGTGS